MSEDAAREERRVDEAIAWHAALESDDADWDGFTHWLEAAPENRAAFDQVALVERIVDDRAPALAAIAAPAVERPRERRLVRTWLGGAVAAALVGGVAVTSFIGQAADTLYATAAGQHRTLALGDGVVVDLGPSSRLIAAGGKATALELAGGEAFFAVQHDPARTLAVTAGGVTVTDIGTRFAVSTASSGTRIGVADGRVSVATADGATTPVAAGEEFVKEAGGDPRLTHVAAPDVGSWRRGRLSYTDVPIGIVVADIQRYVDRPIAVDPSLRGRRFSGVLVVGDGSKLAEDLAGLMGMAVREDGKRIRLVVDTGR